MNLTKTHPDRSASSPGQGRLAGAVILHALVAWLLYSRPLYLVGDLASAAAAVPVAQSSLLSIWIARLRIHASYRLLATIGTAYACWLGFGRHAMWSWESAAALTWAIAMLVQSVSVLVSVACFVPGERRHRTPIWRFSLATMLRWTATMAFLLAATRTAILYYEWSPRDLEWARLLRPVPAAVACGAIAWSLLLATGGHRLLALATILGGFVIAGGYPAEAAAPGDATSVFLMTHFLLCGLTLLPLRDLFRVAPQR